MWRVLAFVLLTLCLFDGGRPAVAGDSMDWVVRKLTGTVTYDMVGGQTVPVESGDFLAPGMSIRTGDNGRARLERGVEWLVIVPNSRVTILEQPEAGMESGVRVETGKIGVHIQKRSGKHFSVGAPNLVAVVKGTTFSVRVAGTDNEVEVREGLVEVSSRASGEVADVGAGQRASVTNGSLSLGGKAGDGPAQNASEGPAVKIYTVLPKSKLAPPIPTKEKPSKGKKGKKGKAGPKNWNGHVSPPIGRGPRDDDDHGGPGGDDDDNSGPGGGDDDNRGRGDGDDDD